MNREFDAAGPTSRAHVGRAPTTSRGELSHVALTLFMEKGFDETTIDDIVAAAGIGRRTFFRYFASKNELPWGDFDALLGSMREDLAASDPAVPLMDALRHAVIEFNRFPDDEMAMHRNRMEMLLHVPSLVAYSTLRYASWRQVIAEFVAGRRGESPSGLTAQTISWGCLGLCLGTYENWLEDEGADLLDLLDDAFRTAADIFGLRDETP